MIGQEIIYSPPSGDALGGFQYNQDDSVIINLRDKLQLIHIPFTGDEKMCFDCGGTREIVVETNLLGEYKGCHEVCDVPIEQLAEAFHND